MIRLRYVHWNREEAQNRARRLGGDGVEVIWEVPGGRAFLREVEEQAPDCILIDLSRLPSQGRDLGVGLRMRKGTRHIPLVFIGGKPDKVKRVRAVLPDAFYTNWADIPDTIQRALDPSPEELVVPESVFAAYTGKPLVAKLGIRAGMSVSLIEGPEHFERILGDLPGGVSVKRDLTPSPDLLIWFVVARRELDEGLASMAEWAKKAPLWIAWPKQRSAKAVDLTQQDVRGLAMARGLVDYRICAIDEDWSALLFTWRGS